MKSTKFNELMQMHLLISKFIIESGDDKVVSNCDELNFEKETQKQKKTQKQKEKNPPLTTM